MTLREWLKANDRTIKWLSAECDTSYMTVYKWVSGTHIPGRDAMALLHALTGGHVTPNDFYDLPLLNGRMAEAPAKPVPDKRQIDMFPDQRRV